MEPLWKYRYIEYRTSINLFKVLYNFVCVCVCSQNSHKLGNTGNKRKPHFKTWKSHKTSDEWLEHKMFVIVLKNPETSVMFVCLIPQTERHPGLSDNVPPLSSVSKGVYKSCNTSLHISRFHTHHITPLRNTLNAHKVQINSWERL